MKKAEGVVLGRPRVLSRELVERSRQARQGGETLAAIADVLNDEAVSNAYQGARRHRATIDEHLHRVIEASDDMGQSVGAHGVILPQATLPVTDSRKPVPVDPAPLYRTR